MNQDNIWQVKVNGEIYETNLSALPQWIAEGSLLPGDKVRCGNLGWLEAGRVPALAQFFAARKLGLGVPGRGQHRHLFR